MMTGMEMMFKSMGVQTDALKQLLDPENVKALLAKVETMCNDIGLIKASVLRLEIKFETVPVENALQLLAENKEQMEQEVIKYVRDNGDGSDND